MDELPDRQSFLGEDLRPTLEQTVIGVVGLSGGGSHVVQQLAHIGFSNFVLCDPDRMEWSNLHRLVGATEDDARNGRLKVEIATRTILGVCHDARIQPIASRWEAAAESLRRCDVLFGCVDTFEARRDLEATARRFLVPYIDIGMDVAVDPPSRARMYGQVFVSMPGAPCMHCLSLFRGRSAPGYGDAGGRPQVVWANGVLASTAVGCAVRLLTGWTPGALEVTYLSYDGNAETVRPHPRAEYLKEFTCPHYAVTDLGTPPGIEV